MNKSCAKQAKDITKHAKDAKGKELSENSKYKYEYALKNMFIWCRQNFEITRINQITADMAYQYLYERAEYVQQSTLDIDRLAFTVLRNHSKSKLNNIKIEYVKSNLKTNLTCRLYTRSQIDLIKSHQGIKHALATEISYVAGLRAHELMTLRKIEEQPIDNRKWSKNKYLGREHWIQYSVIGKGGLIREVRLPPHLAEELEKFRRPDLVRVTDRKIYYQSAYDIGYGNNWSSSFSAASKRSLGWSRGAHGARHSFAQKRMSELQNKGLSFEESLKAVSSELGHIRPEITKVYLR